MRTFLPTLLVVSLINVSMPHSRYTIIKLSMKSLTFITRLLLFVFQNFCNVIKVLAEDNIYFLSYSFFVVARFALSNFINTDIATIFHVNMYLVFLVVVANCSLPEHYCFSFNHVQKVTFYASGKIVHLVEFKR